MKDFKELTNQEVYDLTSEEIEIYKKLVLAENGVKFPVEPIKPELEEECINVSLSNCCWFRVFLAVFHAHRGAISITIRIFARDFGC